jgi:hypothetical protein
MDSNPYAPPLTQDEPPEGASALTEGELREGAPRSVKLAVRCLWSMIGVLGVVAVTAALDWLPAPSVSRSLGSNLVSLAVWSLVTFKVSQRRRWARGVLAVFSAFVTLGLVAALLRAPRVLAARPSVLLAAALAQLVLMSVATLSLFTASASRWFKAGAARERSKRGALGGAASLPGGWRETPFRAGRSYRVKKTFKALRDDFRKGEILVFSHEGYSRYDGVTGYFFRAPPETSLRAWDIGDDDRTTVWSDLFEEVDS